MKWKSYNEKAKKCNRPIIEIENAHTNKPNKHININNAILKEKKNEEIQQKIVSLNSNSNICKHCSRIFNVHCDDDNEESAINIVSASEKTEEKDKNIDEITNDIANNNVSCDEDTDVENEDSFDGSFQTDSRDSDCESYSDIDEKRILPNGQKRLTKSRFLNFNEEKITNNMWKNGNKNVIHECFKIQDIASNKRLATTDEDDHRCIISSKKPKKHVINPTDGKDETTSDESIFDEQVNDSVSNDDVRGIQNVQKNQSIPKTVKVSEKVKLSAHRESNKDSIYVTSPPRYLGGYTIPKKSEDKSKTEKVHTQSNAIRRFFGKRVHDSSAMRRKQNPIPKNSSKYHSNRILREINAANRKSSNAITKKSESSLQAWKPSAGSKTIASIAQSRSSQLVNLYKCMDVSCNNFTNSNSTVFKKHLMEHENSLQTATDEKSFLKCAYCIIQASNSSNLIQHIDNEHKQCSFQCGYCSFRSYSEFQISCHQRDHHEYLERKFFKCNNGNSLSNLEIFLQMKNRPKFGLEPFECTGETSSHFLPVDFVKRI